MASKAFNYMRGQQEPTLRRLLMTLLSEFGLCQESEMKFKTLIVALLFHAHRIVNKYYTCI